MNPVHTAIIAHLRDIEELASRTDTQIMRQMFTDQRGERGERGMRLTKFGLRIMQSSFESFDVQIPEDESLKPRHLIYLDERVTTPYYLDQDHIVVFDYRLGIKLRLIDGRISTLIDIEP